MAKNDLRLHRFTVGFYKELDKVIGQVSDYVCKPQRDRVPLSLDSGAQGWLDQTAVSSLVSASSVARTAIATDATHL